MDQCRNRLSLGDSHGIRPKPFLHCYDTNVEMWISPGDSHDENVEIEDFDLFMCKLLNKGLSLSVRVITMLLLGSTTRVRDYF